MQVPILPKDVISDKSPQRGKGDASPYTSKGCDIKKGDAQSVDPPKILRHPHESLARSEKIVWRFSFNAFNVFTIANVLIKSVLLNGIHSISATTYYIQ